MELKKIVSLLKSDLDSDNLLGYELITHNNHNIRLVNEMLNYYGLKIEVDLSNGWIQVGTWGYGLPVREFIWKMIRLPEDHRDNIVMP